MWTLSLTHKFLISFWKLEQFMKNMILEDIADIRRHADIIDEFENIQIVDEHDNSVVVPEHMINYNVDHDLKIVHVIAINPKGIEQKLNGYRS